MTGQAVSQPAISVIQIYHCIMTNLCTTGFWFTCGGYCWKATDTAWMCPTCIHVKATRANNLRANTK